MEQEIFKDIPGYEGLYQVSNLGRVKSLEKYRKVCKNSYRIYPQKILKPVTSCNRKYGNYVQVTLAKHDSKKRYNIHTLVLITFVGKCPPNLQSRHLNGNPSDNRLSNLIWGTSKQNANDRTLHNHNCPGDKNGNSKLKHDEVLLIKELLKQKYTHKIIASRFNVSETAVSNIKRKITWKHITDTPKLL